MIDTTINVKEDTMIDTTITVNESLVPNPNLCQTPGDFVRQVLCNPSEPAVLVVGNPHCQKHKVFLDEVDAHLTEYRLRRDAVTPMEFIRLRSGAWYIAPGKGDSRTDPETGRKWYWSAYVVIYYNGDKTTDPEVMRAHFRMRDRLDLPVDDFYTGGCLVEEITGPDGLPMRVVIW